MWTVDGGRWLVAGDWWRLGIWPLDSSFQLAAGVLGICRTRGAFRMGGRGSLRAVDGTATG